MTKKKKTSTHNLIKIMACPVCNNALSQISDKLVCTQKHEYKIVDGVPVMAEIDSYLQIEAKAWEDEWKKSVSKQALFAYEKNMNVFRRLGFWEESGEAAGFISSDKNPVVLDLGCGNGVSTANIGGKYVVGLDLSRAQLIRAKKNFPNCDFVVGDARHLPFKNGTFDMIVAINMLHHIQDPENVLADCYRVLKRGGVLLTVDPNLYNPVGFIGRGIFQLLDLRGLFPSFPQFALGRDEYQFSKEAYYHLFKKSPFKKYVIKPHRIERLLFFSTILFPILAKIPFYEFLLWATSTAGNRLVQIEPIDRLCYFWMGRATK